ncbi:MAG: PH domain-containing protein, partial [Rikenellaceae bacterium]|nr:PH domain-containing protein [Rikenellaceae bacterium]
MQIDFIYKPDKRARILTWVICITIILTAAFFMYYSQSGYFPIWFTFFLLTVLLLCILSIPRKIRVTDQALQIQCVVEMTRIELENIVNIRKMERSEMKYSVPLLGSYGFFGYYGWYYNFEEFSLYKVYA